jgi:acyl-CoA reductase-like NAD-dependent aldehyde dehydrogenase
MKRIEILKTYKIYIGGQFPRTESGRYYTVNNSEGKGYANVCLCSRKDVRNAVIAARKAQGAWAERSAFNRGQILYRIAEMLEGRKIQFVDELTQQGQTKKSAQEEVNMAIERLVYYAGWCDKYNQILSSVNPVSSSHFNFSSCEPMGVVGIIPDQQSPLLGLISLLAPVIAGGNTAIVLSSVDYPLCAVTFAEVLHASDVPGGVVNILTGALQETAPTLSSHMDVNAIVTSNLGKEVNTPLQLAAVDNLKRYFDYRQDWNNSSAQGLHFIGDLQEIKTTWHPIEQIGGATSSY